MKTTSPSPKNKVRPVKYLSKYINNSKKTVTTLHAKIADLKEEEPDLSDSDVELHAYYFFY